MYSDQCVICDKPLGQESKDSNYPFCHECRICVKCGQPLRAAECKLCINRYIELEDDKDDAEKTPIDYKAIEVIHPLCMATRTDDPILSIRQSEYDRLNQFRLCLEVDNNLSLEVNKANSWIACTKLFSELNLEEKQIYIEKIEANAAALRLLLIKDPKYNKNLLQERERKHQAKALAERDKILHKSEPKPEPKNHTHERRSEDSIKEFALKWKYDDIKEASVSFTNYTKTIQNLSKSLGEVGATKIADEMMTKNMEVRLGPGGKKNE